MKYKKALKIAQQVKAQLAPHCYKIEIAGGIRRKKAKVKVIEIVAIPKPYKAGACATGIAVELQKWPKVKGTLPCKYTQRILPQGIKLDLFIVTPQNWGLLYAIRTGPAEYSHKVLATGWVEHGYKSAGGYLTSNGVQIPVYNEIDLYNLIGIKWVDPQLRKYP